MLILVAAALLGYLLGSIPFGLVLTRLAGLGDIRQIGSGNIGATNVLRTGNKPLALATLLLDSGKGAVAALVALDLAGRVLGPDMAMTDPAMTAAVLAAGGAMLGHSFPVWLGFKGGKGVATAIGVLLAVCWPVGLLACLTWLVVAGLFRISSLSALTAIALSPLTGWWFGGPLVAGLCLFIAILVFIRHEANIRRLLKGEEPKIGVGKRK